MVDQQTIRHSGLISRQIFLLNMKQNVHCMNETIRITKREKTFDGFWMICTAKLNFSWKLEAYNEFQFKFTMNRLF